MEIASFLKGCGTSSAAVEKGEKSYTPQVTILRCELPAPSIQYRFIPSPAHLIHPVPNSTAGEPPTPLILEFGFSLSGGLHTGC